MSTKRLRKHAYSVAVSKQTGCIVMVRTDGQTISVVGSLTREQSLDFVRQIAEWSEEVIREEAPRIATKPTRLIGLN